MATPPNPRGSGGKRRGEKRATAEAVARQREERREVFAETLSALLPGSLAAQSARRRNKRTSQAKVRQVNRDLQHKAIATNPHKQTEAMAVVSSAVAVSDFLRNPEAMANLEAKGNGTLPNKGKVNPRHLARGLKATLPELRNANPGTLPKGFTSGVAPSHPKTGPGNRLPQAVIRKRNEETKG